MGIIDKFDRRAALMGKMAETVGVDFAEQIVSNPYQVAKYRDAVMRCMGCTHDAECKGWMADHPQAGEAPDYCHNKDLLGQLANS